MSGGVSNLSTVVSAMVLVRASSSSLLLLSTDGSIYSCSGINEACSRTTSTISNALHISQLDNKQLLVYSSSEIFILNEEDIAVNLVFRGILA